MHLQARHFGCFPHRHVSYSCKQEDTPAIRLSRSKETEHGMAQYDKACLMGSNTDDRYMLHELVAALLLTPQEDTHLTCH